jgi:hypothetical protein
MSWAARRRFFILLIVGAVAVAFLSIVLISTIYETPTCSDGVQNQDELGVDCGGSCSYLCTAQVQPPTILFTKAITNSVGRTDVVALVENKNTGAAAKDVPYQVALYGAGQTLLQNISGRLDLPPGSTQVVYIPGAAVGQRVETAFLDIASTSPVWLSLPFDPRMVPVVSNVAQIGSPSAPRITATLTNSSVVLLTNVRVVVLVRGARGEVIAVSQTVVPVVQAQSQASATFTWNEPFPRAVESIQVVPVIPLP